MYLKDLFGNDISGIANGLKETLGARGARGFQVVNLSEYQVEVMDADERVLMILGAYCGGTAPIESETSFLIVQSLTSKSSTSLGIGPKILAGTTSERLPYQTFLASQ